MVHLHLGTARSIASSGRSPIAQQEYPADQRARFAELIGEAEWALSLSRVDPHLVADAEIIEDLAEVRRQAPRDIAADRDREVYTNP